MKNIFNYILLIISIIAFNACGLLEQDSLDGVSTEEVFKTADGIRSARLGLYSMLGNQSYYGGYFPMIIEAHSDNGATGGYDIESLDELSEKRLTSANLYNEKLWIAIYGTANAANRILENIEKVEDLDTLEAQNIRGEALFVRALCHFDALRVWGEHWDKTSEYGVPISTKTQGVGSAIGRSTVQASYDAILADLIEADSLVAPEIDPSTAKSKSNIYITKNAVKALLARTYQYFGDKDKAISCTNALISSNKFDLFIDKDFSKLYNDRQTKESIFELKFDLQNRSFFNALTYKRPEALRPEISFLAAADLNDFFKSRLGDVRSTTVSYSNNDESIAPDGRSQKYRGEDKQDNPAYILRYAEMYLILAEARGKDTGLDPLNVLRQKRGLPTLRAIDIDTDEKFEEALLAERRAELNMEGHRFFDLARAKKVEDILGKDVKSVFPIPLREIAATNGALKQYFGY